jgi:hypothetical protein
VIVQKGLMQKIKDYFKDIGEAMTMPNLLTQPQASTIDLLPFELKAYKISK